MNFLNFKDFVVKFLLAAILGLLVTGFTPVSDSRTGIDCGDWQTRERDGGGYCHSPYHPDR